VRPGQTVLVKPNLLTDAPPDEGKTTHPEVVRALLRMLKASGVRCFVADSPASVLKDRTGVGTHRFPADVRRGKRAPRQS